ncbi:phage tail assembly chaperone [Lachnoclostridium phytofermentans]|uniref:phage tail assembly chaperone n=1 Tax=Lachnoclostridium phytofermentans TaxID=66219 RepID=UPI00049824FC|nr:hypothetical protein [Lachnoclostridium phytofermentans]
MNTLDLLLNTEVQSLPEKEYKLKRLSTICGSDVIFKLRALTYSHANNLAQNHMEELNVHTVLAGTIEPNLKDNNLLEKYSAVTPAELVKKMLLPGEIEDLSRAIEKLSGYRQITVEEIKKK